MLYDLVRPWLFKLSAETAHELTLDGLSAVQRLGLGRFIDKPIPSNPVTAFGLTFDNPVGLAAGLDKNGDHLDALGRLGFGFIEIGTVTPRPQLGNPQPRLFRVPEYQGIINRMGFNNKGVDYLIERVRSASYKGILGINIGKNADTPLEDATRDYLVCMEKVYPYAHYITVNLSSPNTPGLRSLQFGDGFKSLLIELKRKQAELSALQGQYKPVLIKIAPDMESDDLRWIARTLLEHKIDGVIATNTTLDRTALGVHPLRDEAGGLSGAPLTQKAQSVTEILAAEIGNDMPIIGVGGIMNGAHAAERYQAGAHLVQIYSGLIYRGPELIAEVADALVSAQAIADK